MLTLRNFIFALLWVFCVEATNLQFPNKTLILKDISHLKVNERLALWAEFFVGTPYDTIPIGNYVQEGVIVNDDDLFIRNRFEYGEDMAFFGKFGRVVSHEVGRTQMISGGKRYEGGIPFLPSSEALQNLHHFKMGDIIFFIKDLKFRKVGEIVGHIGILKVEKGEVFLIHASGTKGGGGEVKKVLFLTYLKKMEKNFVGVLVNRI